MLKNKRKNSKKLEEESVEEESLSFDNKANETNKECIVVLNLLVTSIPSEDNDNDFVKDKCLCIPLNPYTDRVYEEQEIIPELTLPVTEDNKVQLSKLINRLCNYGYPLKASLIYYFSNEAEEYIFCGSEPTDQTIYIPLNAENSSVTLRCHCFLEEDFIKSIGFNATPLKIEEEPDARLNKRTKERKIGQIINKVTLWRKLYNGYYDEEKKFIKFSLEDAAKMLNISKKSLDDYLLQLRLGRKFGFDFNLHKNSRVGILRSFVKNQRSKNNTTANDDANSLM